MTNPTTDPRPASRAVAGPAVSGPADARLAGLALMAGCAIAAIGFLAIGFGIGGPGDDRYSDPLWQPLYGVLLAGSILVVLGFPAVLAVHGHVARRLTLVGYVGLFVPMVMLNVAETTIEAFVNPYLVRHGGVPQETPTGLSAFEAVALLLLIVGAISMAVAVFRGRVLPRWVGIALVASLVTAFALPHAGPLAFVSDYCVLAALFRFGLAAARGPE